MELDPRNAECFLLFGWLIHDDLKPLAPIYARELLRSVPRRDRGAILARVASALRNESVMARLHPKVESNG